MAQGTTSAPWPKTARILLYGVLALLVGSVAINAYLVRSSLWYFRSSLDLRLDPVGLKMYAADRGKPPAGGPLLVFFGDSRAFMWPDPPGPTGYRIVNHGIGNQTTAQILLRVDDDVVKLHPTVVVLEAGVNDLKSIPDFPERRGPIVADCEANLAQIVDRITQGGSEVVLVTVFGIGDVAIWKRAFWSNDVAAAVREVDAFLPSLVGPHVVLLDADQAIDDPGGAIKRDYQMDYLHLSPAGYVALNAKLLPILGSLPK